MLHCILWKHIVTQMCHWKACDFIGNCTHIVSKTFFVYTVFILSNKQMYTSSLCDGAQLRGIIRWPKVLDALVNMQIIN